MSKMDNNLVKRMLNCEKKIIFVCILNNALSLILYSFIRENIHYAFRFPFVSPRSTFFPIYTQNRESCFYMTLARIPLHFIRDMIHYLRRFA